MERGPGDLGRLAHLPDVVPRRSGAESVLINWPEGEAMSAGETSITVTAPAIGNAIFDATGARVREVPFTPERVKAALPRERKVGRIVRTVRIVQTGG